MGSKLLPDPASLSLPRHPIVSSGTHHGSSIKFSVSWQALISRSTSIRRRKVSCDNNWLCRSRTIAYACKFLWQGDSMDPYKDGDKEGLKKSKEALSEAQARQEALQKERDLFNQKLKETVQEKSTLESKLVLAKQEAVELAVKVERLAEIAFRQTTSHILEDAQLRVAAAETSAAEAAYLVEEKTRNATEGTILSILEESKQAIEKASAVAAKIADHAKKAAAELADGIHPIDEVASLQSHNINLQSSVSDLESQMLLAKSEIDRLKLDLEHALAQATAAELHANNAEKALLEFQESSRKQVIQYGEEVKSLVEKMKQDTAESKKATSKAFKVELEGIKLAIEAAKEAAKSKDKAYVRRCEALQRSLRAAENVSKLWKQRTEVAESLLLNERPAGEGVEDSMYVVNGGRIDLLTEDDSVKWKLLCDGPRREVPEWMARRIWNVRPKFPPQKIDVTEALASKSRSLELPKVDEVWSIAEEKLKEGDTLVEHVLEKEMIDKKRKDLEHALLRKSIQWQKTPEQTKLESGTGTGREIVFQGFNWESWRRQWYLDIATKASDLSQCGITAVWLPPPTESVAPQGYMPSDLYNLNSAYGTQDELKYCIEELHTQDILALGDVVLNHRCAHKQSPNGVWNIFGGKLSWGPEAIVCDDPNFQGRGNPSSGDIFHAAPNVDHSQEFVRKDIKEWLNWLRSEIGFDGWRLDFVRGFSGAYVKEYIEASNPAFSIGEYWDSLGYEDGNLCYNQDAHRQRIINWINATGGTSSAFDVTTKGILHSALHNQYWRLIDPQGKPTGVMGWWPSRAVTFIENHDTGSTQGHWPFPREKLAQGYAYILTHPGTPTIFYDHLYDFGMHEVITELVEARKRAGIHCRSPVKIYQANNEGYVAQIGDILVMKMGHLDWNPSKENHLDGSWQKFLDKGPDYQLWIRQ